MMVKMYIHQAFIQVDNILGEGWGVKAGRFELNLGNQRVFGAVGWSNVGRVWEGGMFWYTNNKIKITAYELISELNHYHYDGYKIIGVYTNLKDINFDFFGFYDFKDIKDSLDKDIYKHECINLGVYHKRKLRQFDFELNGVLQLGKIPSFRTIDTTKLDISAFMVTFETGYTFESERNIRIAGAIDFSSGDDDPTDDKIQIYNNLYYTGHKFRGYMDYFVSSRYYGLMDIILRSQFDPIPGWTVKSDFHYFSATQDYADVINGGRTKNIGFEIDLTVKTARIKGIAAQWGASIFLPSESFARMIDPDLGLWFYYMGTVNF